MRFAILADIHLGPEGHYRGVLRKINRKAKSFLQDFVEQINNEVKPDFVVVLGDLIEDDDLKNDIENVKYIVDFLKRLECPAHYVAGNHDLRNMSESELTQLFEQERLYYSFDAGDFHFIVLFSRVVGKEISSIPDNQVRWLKEDLKKTGKRCIVFVHHGLAEQDLKGNPWFEGKPGDCLIRNRKDVIEILEQSGKVLAVFNSHLHWDKMDVHNSIPYFTIQSLVENEGDKGLASEAYAVVNVSNNKVAVEVEGKYPKRFSHRF